MQERSPAGVAKRSIIPIWVWPPANTVTRPENRSAAAKYIYGFTALPTIHLLRIAPYSLARRKQRGGQRGPGAAIRAARIAPLLPDF